MRRWIGPVAAVWATLLAVPAGAGTLDDVKARGRVNCGVSDGLPGFSSRDDRGTWSGFDVDFCRAVAAAVFGEPDRVTFVPLNATERFDALKAKKVDLLSRNTSWTAGRDLGLGLEFAGVAFFDGQGFLAKVSDAIFSALELDTARVCVLANTTSEANAAAWFAAKSVSAVLVRVTTRAEARAAYLDDKCDVFTADRSALSAERARMARPEDHNILQEVISKEPLGPVTRKGDAAWSDLVRWVLFGMINAEEAGIDQAGLTAKGDAAATKRAAAMALGKSVAVSLRLADDWLVAVVARVGNYGDVFDRNLGEGSALGIERGLNALWDRGGLLYAPPMQ